MSQTLLLHHPAEAEEPQADTVTTPKRSRIVAIVVLLGLIVAWFAPAFVARSVLRHRLVHAVAPSYPGSVSVGSASLGWGAPVVLEDVVLRDADGSDLLHVEEFRTSNTLFSLLARRSQGLGTLTLARPRLTVQLTSKGSNLEEMVRPLLEDSGSGSSCTILITEGEIGWTALGGTSVVAALKNVAASIECGQSSHDLQVELKGEISDGEHRGTITLRSEPVGADVEADQVSCVAQDLPLVALQPWLDRFETGVGVTGTGNADLLCTVPHDDKSWKVDGRIAARRLRLACRSSNETNFVLVEEASLAGKASVNGLRLNVEQAELRSDLINAKIDGVLDLSNWGSSEWLDAVHALLESDLSLRGSANLAQAALALPTSLRLRQPVRSGILAFDVRTTGTATGRRGTLRLSTSDLIAGPAEDSIVWQKPLAMDVTLRKSEADLVVEQAKIDSEFLQLNGSGSSNGADLTFSTDLDRLRELLSRFMDLPKGSLGGRAEGHLTAVREDPQAPIDVTATATVRDWQLQLADREWSERELHVESTARLAERSNGRAIESGHLSLKSVEGDEAQIELQKPTEIGDLPFGHFAVSARGSSRRWHERARALNLLPRDTGWSIDGDAVASGNIEANEETVRAAKLNIDAKHFRLATPSQTFDESFLHFIGDVAWNRTIGELTSAASKLECESAAINAKNLKWSVNDAMPSAGHFDVRGGIGRLARYVMPARPPVWVSGVIAGTIDVTRDAKATTFGGAFDLERPLVTMPTQVTTGAVTWRPVWSDDAARVAVTGQYHHLTDSLDLSELKVTSSGLALAAKGRIDQLRLAANADLSGAVTYDWPVFAKHVPAWPSDVTLQGQGTKPFVVRGPLISAEGIDPSLIAEARIDWTSLDAWGMGVNGGELAARLERKTVLLGPFECAVAAGRVRASGSVPLMSPWPLRIAPGKVIENVELSPELCRKWLRYATPMLADATTVRGKASLGVASCVVPLAAPSAVEGEATLLLENLDATAGPLAQSLIETIAQVQRIAGREATRGSDLRLVAPQQSVGLRMTNARVFHDRFAVQLGDADGPIVTTSGSVGVDESIDLVVAVPLDAKWFKDERVAQTLGGQILRIPVRGTLSNPTPDPRALQDFARRAATGAVNGLLNREIEKQLGDPLRKLLDR